MLNVSSGERLPSEDVYKVKQSADSQNRKKQPEKMKVSLGQLGRHSSTPLLTDSISNLSSGGTMIRKSNNKLQQLHDFDFNQMSNNLTVSKGSATL